MRCPLPEKEQPRETSSGSEVGGIMDIDSALNELGMLSAVTDSQQDYQKEMAEKKCQASSCFHVVSANPQFVVNIGAVHQRPGTKRTPLETPNKASQASKSYIRTSEYITKASNDRRTYKMSERMHHRYFFRPYSKNRRHSRCAGLVNRSPRRPLESGGFQLRLPPPTESTLTQAMASMQIERGGASSDIPGVSVDGTGMNHPSSSKPRNGLRGHAR